MEQTELKETNKPVHKIQVGGMHVAVWNNEKDGKHYNSVSLQKRYKGNDGDWHTSAMYFNNDLPYLILALQKTYEWLLLRGEDGEF